MTVYRKHTERINETKLYKKRRFEAISSIAVGREPAILIILFEFNAPKGHFLSILFTSGKCCPSEVSPKNQQENSQESSYFLPNPIFIRSGSNFR